MFTLTRAGRELTSASKFGWIGLKIDPVAVRVAVGNANLNPRLSAPMLCFIKKESQGLCLVEVQSSAGEGSTSAGPRSVSSF